MKQGSHTGITGIPNQDMAMWETMGPIADRSRERLGASDVAIVQFRRIMVEAAKKLRDGGPAIGTSPSHVPHVKLKSFEGIVLENDPVDHARRRRRGARVASGFTGVVTRTQVTNSARITMLSHTNRR